MDAKASQESSTGYGQDMQAWSADLHAAKSGDSNALGRLLQLFWQSLWEQASGELNRELHPKCSPSDLVQETLMEAQRDFLRFRGNSQAELHAWLRQILTNNVRDVWRRYLASDKRNVSLEMPLLDDNAQSLNGRKNPLRYDSGVRSFEKRELILHGIAKLPEDIATVLKLRHFEKQHFEDIAAKLSKSTRSVRYLWYRGLVLLAQAIRRDDLESK